MAQSTLDRIGSGGALNGKSPLELSAVARAVLIFAALVAVSPFGQEKRVQDWRRGFPRMG